MCGYGVKKLNNIIHYWLGQEPPQSKTDLTQCKYLIFDGTYFKKTNCLILLLDHTSNKILDGDYTKRENYHSAFAMLSKLKQQGLNPRSLTTDGNTAVCRAIKDIWPNAISQRCLVHIQRQGLSWLRRRPKSQAAIELRELLLSLTAIKSEKDKRRFIGWLKNWENQFGKQVLALPRHDKVFSDLQATRGLIFHALPDMFHYLNNPDIPSTTNKLEGIFSRMKQNLNLHKGLRKSNRLQYFKWYIYFKNR